MFINVIIKQKHYDKKKKQECFPLDLKLHWKESHHVNTKNSIEWYDFLKDEEVSLKFSNSWARLTCLTISSGEPDHFGV